MDDGIAKREANKYLTREELLERIENDFTYHAPIGTQAERYEQIRSMTRILARAVVVMCPGSRELSLALTHLEEAVFWFNAAIARNEQRGEKSCH
jgi:glycyl-tRNA synthetase beta subunit